MYKYTMKCTNQRTFKITACQGLLSYHRQIGKQEDPGDEVGDEPPCKSLVQRSRTLMQKRPLFGRTQRQINIYSSHLIIDDISAMTLRLILLKNYGNKTLKRTCTCISRNIRTNIKCFRSDQSSVWTKKKPRIGNQLRFGLSYCEPHVK